MVVVSPWTLMMWPIAQLHTMLCNSAERFLRTMMVQAATAMRSTRSCVVGDVGSAGKADADKDEIVAGIAAGTRTVTIRRRTAVEIAQEMDKAHAGEVAAANHPHVEVEEVAGALAKTTRVGVVTAIIPQSTVGTTARFIDRTKLKMPEKIRHTPPCKQLCLRRGLLELSLLRQQRAGGLQHCSRRQRADAEKTPAAAEPEERVDCDVKVMEIPAAAQPEKRAAGNVQVQNAPGVSSDGR